MTPARSLSCQQSVLLENDYVRVVEFSVKAGESGEPHTQLPKVSYLAGAVRITLSDTPARIVLVEVKRVDGQPAPPSEDPPTVNKVSIRVLLENDSVRVMEAALPPGFKERQHTHPPYVTYIQTGGSVRMHFPDGSTRDLQFNTGEARFSDKVTHWAENTGTSTIRLMLVELRRR